jgi:hypothetical protein
VLTGSIPVLTTKQMNMSNKIKCYVNGKEEKAGEFTKAKEVLIRKGLYQTLGNFGPYFPNKLQRVVNLVETFVLDGFEFTIVESEVMALSTSSVKASSSNNHKEAWYQPA